MRYLTQRLYDRSAERNVGHEVSIHHIHVNAAGSGLLCLSDLFAQPSEVGSEDRWSQLNSVFYHFRVFPFHIHEWRLDDVVKPRKRSRIGVDNISSVQRQRQLPSTLPGRFMRASAPKLSRSCNGAIASAALEDHAKWISSQATSSLLPPGRLR